MIANVDISLQISQLNKTGNSKRHKGSAMGMVSSDKKVRNSVFLSQNELTKIINFYKKYTSFSLKTIFVRIHSVMIYYSLEPYLDKISKIKICSDFVPHVLTRQLYQLYPFLKTYKVEWVGGKNNKSVADKYANKVRKHPEFANSKLTLDIIKKMEAPRKSK